jgi:hypothetical protein
MGNILWGVHRFGAVRTLRRNSFVIWHNKQELARKLWLSTICQWKVLS